MRQNAFGRSCLETIDCFCMDLAGSYQLNGKHVLDGDDDGDGEDAEILVLL